MACKAFAGPALAALGGVVWLAGGNSLWGPFGSILLPVATKVSSSRNVAFASALVYYLTGSVSIAGAVAGYYGTGSLGLGLLAWVGSSGVLALPWMLGRHAPGRFCALVVTALPPLGVIGWLSPLNVAGVLFPGTGLLGLGLTVAVLTWCDAVCWRPRVLVFALIVLGSGLYAGLYSLHQLEPPPGWVGLNTEIAPARGDLIRDLANKQALIEAGRAVRSARVVVFPEAVLDDWLAGTRQQFALAVPPGQTWLIGAQVGTRQAPGFVAGVKGKSVNAVVAVAYGRAQSVALTAASGLLLGGNWRPWSAQGLQPARTQHVFELDGQRVWAALCAEQLQPWTWMLAMLDHPTLVLAMNNAWWAPAESFALGIQAASVRAWTRLMGAPVIWAGNS